MLDMPYETVLERGFAVTRQRAATYFSQINNFVLLNNDNVGNFDGAQ
jgi:hypothetical protein